MYPLEKFRRQIKTETTKSFNNVVYQATETNFLNWCKTDQVYVAFPNGPFLRYPQDAFENFAIGRLSLLPPTQLMRNDTKYKNKHVTHNWCHKLCLLLFNHRIRFCVFVCVLQLTRFAIFVRIFCDNVSLVSFVIFKNNRWVWCSFVWCYKMLYLSARSYFM